MFESAGLHEKGDQKKRARKQTCPVSHMYLYVVDEVARLATTFAL
jgi:hypothetical protein